MAKSYQEIPNFGCQMPDIRKGTVGRSILRSSLLQTSQLNIAEAADKSDRLPY